MTEEAFYLKDFEWAVKSANIIGRVTLTAKEINWIMDKIKTLTKERDAAISDLKYLPSTTCKYANTDYCTNDCLCDKYEWRGIQNETD